MVLRSHNRYIVCRNLGTTLFQTATVFLAVSTATRFVATWTNRYTVLADETALLFLWKLILIYGVVDMYVFSATSLSFLVENRLNNSREWFLQNKNLYELHLFYPFQRLAKELTPTMLRIDPSLEVAPVVGKSISRINRDIRFSKDKSLYRDTMWLVFMEKSEDKADYPGFFFEINSESYRYGMGFISASVKTMDMYRLMLKTKEEQFLDIVSKIEQEKIFIPEGDFYKKSRYDGKVEYIADWYNRKNINLVNNRNKVSEIFDFEKLVEQLSYGFNSLSGLYFFFKEICWKRA
jgi:uncharacterized protein (TIGR02453 family)